jgi:hypothetical protein
MISRHSRTVHLRAATLNFAFRRAFWCAKYAWPLAYGETTISGTRVFAVPNSSWRSAALGFRQLRPVLLALRLDGLKRQVWKRDSIEMFIQRQQAIAASLGVCPN